MQNKIGEFSMRDTLTLLPNNTKMTDPDNKDWRQARAKIRGTGEGCIAPRLDARQIIDLFSPGMKGAYVNRHGCCVKDAWSDVKATRAGKIINHIIDAMHMIAKAFCPLDSLSLVNAVFHFISISADVDTANGGKISYKAWSQQRLLQLLLTEFNKSNKRDRRRKILSWVASTKVKKKWICELFDVTYDALSTARRHANVWLPGGEKCRLYLGKKSYRPSARSVFLRQWVKDNSTYDPAGKKAVITRLLPRYSGYKMYVFDVRKAKEQNKHPGKPYVLSRFYTHPAQKGITNAKCSAGSCSICVRYGTQVFESLLQHAITITRLMKPVLTFDITEWRKSYKKVRQYFQRGGMFQRNLKMGCKNIHHCLQCGLSHPTDEMYQHKCEHEHTEVDDVCLLRDRLWKELNDFIDGALSSQDERVVRFLNSTGIVGELDNTTHSKKLLNIRESLATKREGHNKYVGHLMLESAQSKKRFEIRANVSFTYTRTYTFARTYTCTYTERQTHPLIHH